MEQVRENDARHIDLFPEGEREETRQIIAANGFEGEVLDRIVDVITHNRKQWIDTMVTEEYRLQLNCTSPWRVGKRHSVQAWKPSRSAVRRLSSPTVRELACTR